MIGMMIWYFFDKKCQVDNYTAQNIVLTCNMNVLNVLIELETNTNQRKTTTTSTIKIWSSVVNLNVDVTTTRSQDGLIRGSNKIQKKLFSISSQPSVRNEKRVLLPSYAGLSSYNFFLTF